METLFSEFKETSAGEWKARLEKDLKGVTFEQLQLQDRNGITIHPFYTLEDRPESAAPVFLKPDWEICALVHPAGAADANKQALQELQGGASGLCFTVDETTDWAVLLDGIGINYIYTRWVVHEKPVKVINAFTQYLLARQLRLADLNCTIVYDPVGNYLRSGTWNETASENTFLKLTETDVPMLGIDASVFHNAGATSSYELAAALAQVNEYLHWCAEAGAGDRIRKIQVTLAAGTGFYEEIAKLRAFRLLLDQVTEVYGIAPELWIHVETSGLYRSRFDVYSNLLRDTVAGMAGVLGGADSLLIRPFDEQLQPASRFSDRMCRNQQLIFKEESYLHKVADVAAGSYYLETLTRQIADKAWAGFQSIEQAGGLLSAFDKGLVKKEIEEQAAHLTQEYREGRRVLIGVNKYPNPADKPQPTMIRPMSSKGLQPLFLDQAILYNELKQ